MCGVGEGKNTCQSIVSFALDFKSLIQCVCEPPQQESYNWVGFYCIAVILA